METRRVPTTRPGASAETFDPQRPWGVSSRVTTILALAGIAGLAPQAIQADQLRLVERADGHEVELLEEQPDAFVVKIPKSEVALIKRETPTEIKLWKEKKILWEDQGDYLILSLPKDRILSPTASGEEGDRGYGATTSLAEGLAQAGVEGRPGAFGALRGDMIGRVVRDGRPLVGCRVRLVPIEGPATALTKLLRGQQTEAAPSGPIETVSDADGRYRFDNVPIGDYDVSWLPPGSTQWLGWLSEKPDVTVRGGQITQQGEIDL